MRNNKDKSIIKKFTEASVLYGQMIEFANKQSYDKLYQPIIQKGDPNGEQTCVKNVFHNFLHK
jgi:hypothetical protein